MKEHNSNQQGLWGRIQRIRVRMHIENISGVSTDDRTAFLSACDTYEQAFVRQFSNSWQKGECQIDQKHQVDWRNWKDFSDWHDRASWSK